MTDRFFLSRKAQNQNKSGPEEFVWSDQDQAQLEAAVDAARKGLSFYCLKE